MRIGVTVSFTSIILTADRSVSAGNINRRIFCQWRFKMLIVLVRFLILFNIFRQRIVTIIVITEKRHDLLDQPLTK